MFYRCQIEMCDRGLLPVLTLFLVGGLSACLQAPPPAAPPSSPPLPALERKLEYQVYPLRQSIVHTLKIPAQGEYIVETAMSAQLQTVEDFANSTQAIAVLNGGFFDPENQKSTSAVFEAGQQVAKPEDNERLMNNPDLLPYLDKILNRTEFRRYQCGSVERYDIVSRQELPPVNCQLQDALGAGPRLLPSLTLEQEGFWAVQSGKVVRDAIGYQQPNARSAIGILPDGSLLWVLAAQRPNMPTNSGLSLPELADFMKKLGVEQALNLDGGSSAALFFQGEIFYGKVNASQDAIARPVKSVFLVKSTKKLEKASPVEK